MDLRSGQFDGTSSSAVYLHLDKEMGHKEADTNVEEHLYKRNVPISRHGEVMFPTTVMNA